MDEILRTIKGRFVLSINDRPETREIFAGFRIMEVSTSYSADPKGRRGVTELLISGGGNNS